MNKFISCDWGTTAIRLRLVDTGFDLILAEAISNNGIIVTHDLLKKSGRSENTRQSFYQSILTEHIVRIEKQLNLSLQDIPLIISGMASSSIGMMELPYKEMPFNIDGHDLNIKIIEASDDFQHTSLLISGAKTSTDAMRGEETQLIGCLGNDDKEDHLLIFPGTHSKHVSVKNGEATDVKTYMTGEFFELLSKKSILSNDVEYTRDLLSENNLKSFDQGVVDSLHSDILHSSFCVRTNQLFGKLSKQENYSYLSGLVIGTELKELKNIQVKLELAGEEALVKLYSRALQKLTISGIKFHNASDAVIKAHSKIYERYKSKLITRHTFIKQ